MAGRAVLIPFSKSEFAVGKATQRLIYERPRTLPLPTGAVIETVN